MTSSKGVKSAAAASPAIVEPDAHGQAALLLTESLIHMLVDHRALTNTEAIEVVQIAAEVKVEVASSAGQSSKRMQESLALLTKMQTSFESDQRTGWGGVRVEMFSHPRCKGFRPSVCSAAENPPICDRDQHAPLIEAQTADHHPSSSLMELITI